jgi:hypothetical protein
MKKLSIIFMFIAVWFIFDKSVPSTSCVHKIGNKCFVEYCAEIQPTYDNSNVTFVDANALKGGATVTTVSPPYTVREYGGIGYCKEHK